MIKENNIVIEICDLTEWRYRELIEKNLKDKYLLLEKIKSLMTSMNKLNVVLEDEVKFEMYEDGKYKIEYRYTRTQ